MRILILEDDPTDAERLLEQLVRLGHDIPSASAGGFRADVRENGALRDYPPSNVTVVKSLDLARRVFDQAERGSGARFTHVVADLNISGNDSDYDGFDLVRHVCSVKANPPQVVVLSNFAEDEISRSALSELRRLDMFPHEVLEKPAKEALLRRYLLNIGPITQRLREEGLLFGCSPRIENLLREVKTWAESELDTLIREGDERNAPLPAMVLTGPPGSGKSLLGRLLPYLLMDSSPALKERSEQARLDAARRWAEGRLRHTSGAIYSTSSGEAPNINLFGCRSFGNFGDARGYFEEVTTEERVVKKQPAPAFMAPASRPDRSQPGIVLIDELDKMPTDVKNRLLVPLSEGFVETSGVPTRIAVCAFVVATTAVEGEDWRAERSSHKELYDRLRVFRVPPLWERPEDWVELLQGHVRRRHRCPEADVVITDTAADLIEECIRERTFNCRTMRDIARETVAEPNAIEIEVSLGPVDRVIRTKHLRSFGAAETVVLPTLPGGGTVDVDWVAGGVAPLARELRNVLEGARLGERPRWNAVFDCSDSYFTESTRDRYQASPENRQTWYLAVFRACLEANDDRPFDCRFSFGDDAPSRDHFWLCAVDPVALEKPYVRGMKKTSYLRKYLSALRSGDRTPILPFVRNALEGLATRAAPDPSANECDGVDEGVREFARRLYPDLAEARL